MYLQEIELHAHNTITNLDSILKIIAGVDLYEHEHKSIHFDNE